tara:strand:- start:9597 stop:10829 length:1233 start_codon:yes stop_codon:yes gene_type:complete
MYKWIRNFYDSQVVKLDASKVSAIVTNKAVLYPTVLQLFTAVAPLMFFRFVFQGYPPAEIIIIELLFVFNAFCAVITSWSSTLFLSRIYSRLAKSGAFSTILFNRSITVGCIFVVFFIIQQFTAVIPETSDFLFTLLLFLVAQMFDSSWFYVGQKKLYMPQLQLICQYCLAFIMCYYEAPILLAIGVSWLTISICFFIPIVKVVRFGPVRLSLSLRIFRRFSLPTLSEIATSLFSKLDVLYASVLLTPANAVVYILLRKHILATQSIIFASIRLLYLERDPEELAKINSLIRLYVTLACTLGVIAVSWSVSVLFEYDMSSDDVIALIIFAIGIPLGYYKVQTQLQYAYINGFFVLDLLASFFVFAMYMLCIGVFSFLFTDLLIWIVLARISNDVVYVAIMYMSRIKESLR